MSYHYSTGICITDERRKGAGSQRLTQEKAQDFMESTKKCLDAIKKTKTGMLLVNDINSSGHKVKIYRVENIDDGNAQAGEDVIKSMVVPLDKIHDDDSVELHRVLSLACRDVSKRSKVQKFLRFGKPKPYFPGGRMGIARMVGKSEKQLKEMEFGKRTIDDETDSKLRVYLYDFLTRGEGDDCYVRFNHKKDNLSKRHKKYIPQSHNWKNRPPAVALAHELIHAWRVMKGQVLFEYGWEEEAMTVGIPPFTYMPFTENMIRVEWGGLAVRPHYEYKEFKSHLDESSKIGIDPDTKTWKGKQSSLHPDQFLAQKMSQRRKAMGYEDDDDGF